MEKSGFEGGMNQRFDRIIKRFFDFTVQVQEFNLSVHTLNTKVIPNTQTELDKIAGFDSPEILEAELAAHRAPTSEEKKIDLLTKNKDIINSFPELAQFGLATYSFRKHTEHHDLIGIRVIDPKLFSSFITSFGERKPTVEEQAAFLITLEKVDDWILQSFSEKFMVSSTKKEEDALDFLSALPQLVGKLKSIENKIPYTAEVFSKSEYLDEVYAVSKILDFYSQGSINAFADTFVEQGKILFEIRHFYQEQDVFLKNEIIPIKENNLLQPFLTTRLSVLKEVFKKGAGTTTEVRNPKYRPVFEFLHKFLYELVQSPILRTHFQNPQDLSAIDDFRHQLENLRNKFDAEKL